MTSLVITACYDKFIGKVDELLQTVDLSVELVRKSNMSAPITGGASGSLLVPDVPIQGKLNSSLPGIPTELEWGGDPTELSNWFLRWRLWWGRLI